MKEFYSNDCESRELLKEWRVRPYSKSELAVVYAPEIGYHSALNRFSHWIRTNIALYTELQKTGYKNSQQILTSRQVALVFEYLGEP